MRAKTEVHVAEHLQADHWPLGEFEGEALDRLNNTLEGVGSALDGATGVLPSVDELRARIQALEAILSAIAVGSAPRGRWLDVRSTAIDGFNDEEIPPPDPNAHWEEYSPEEQRIWLDTVTELCRTALEGGDHESEWIGCALLCARA